MTIFDSRTRTVVLLLLSAAFTVLATGCAVDKSETPDAEMSAALKARDDAKAIQAESKTRAAEANSVFDSK